MPLPGWAGIWLAAFPNVEDLVAQAAAALLMLCSYLVVERKKRPRRRASEAVGV